MNVAFYTCSYGSEIDSVIPEIPSLVYPCYYFTNNVKLLEKVRRTKWIGIFDEVYTHSELESVFACRRVQACPHLYAELESFDFLCFLHAKSERVNERFVLEALQAYCVEKEFAILLQKHWYIEHSVWEEYNETLQYHPLYKQEEEKMNKYIEEQKKQGLSDTTPFHCITGVILRNMKHLRMKAINETWYQHIQDCGIQEQISFFFVKQIFEGFIYAFPEKPFMETTLNLAFYACFYGSVNNTAFMIPKIPSETYPCYFFTNNTKMFELLLTTKWRPIYEDKPTTDDMFESNMLGKLVKTCPHKFTIIKDYDFLCYFDSKIQTLDESLVLQFIREKCIKENYALCLRKHWYISGHIWDEYDESMIHHERYRLQSDKIKAYIQKQKDQGLQEKTEYHCANGLLIRNMKHEKINALNETWYQHIQECGIQDQISFFFVKQLFVPCIYAFSEVIF